MGPTPTGHLLTTVPKTNPSNLFHQSPFCADQTKSANFHSRPLRGISENNAKANNRKPPRKWHTRNKLWSKVWILPTNIWREFHKRGRVVCRSNPYIRSSKDNLL